MTKRIAILGSTGSIGKNALRVIDALGPDYSIVALSAHSNIELLAEQARRYKPKFVAVTNSEYTEQFRKLLDDFDVEIFEGAEGLVGAPLFGPGGIERLPRIEQAEIDRTQR